MYRPRAPLGRSSGGRKEIDPDQAPRQPSSSGPHRPVRSRCRVLERLGPRQWAESITAGLEVGAPDIATLAIRSKGFSESRKGGADVGIDPAADIDAPPTRPALLRDWVVGSSRANCGKLEGADACRGGTEPALRQRGVAHLRIELQRSAQRVARLFRSSLARSVRRGSPHELATLGKLDGCDSTSSGAQIPSSSYAIPRLLQARVLGNQPREAASIRGMPSLWPLLDLRSSRENARPTGAGNCTKMTRGSSFAAHDRPARFLHRF